MLKRGESAAPDGVSHCPSHIANDPAAKKEWKRLTALLGEMKLLKETDLVALANYCQQYSILQQASRLLKKGGLISKAPSGYPIVNPAVNIISAATAQLHRISLQFGFTPASRGRIAGLVDPDPQPSKWDED